MVNTPAAESDEQCEATHFIIRHSKQPVDHKTHGDSVAINEEVKCLRQSKVKRSKSEKNELGFEGKKIFPRPLPLSEYEGHAGIYHVSSGPRLQISLWARLRTGLKRGSAGMPLPASV